MKIQKYLIYFMDMNKESSMNDFDAPPPPSDNQEVQPLINGVELSRNPTINSIEPEDQYFEVAQKKQPAFGDEAEFKRLLNQVLKKKQRAHEPPKNVPTITASTIKKKMSKKEEETSKAKAEESKKQKLLKIVEPHVKNFKILNTPNSSDTEVAKLRAECKQKTFKFLLYGIEELKLLKSEDLDEEQRRVAKLTLKDPYALAKTLTTQIDIQLMKNINMQNRQTASKKYKSFLRNFWTNISDESNLDLRRKILTRKLTAAKIATMEEQQFYPAHIRQKLLQRQNFLLREAAATQKPVVTMTEQIEYQPEVYQSQTTEKKQEVKKQKYKYLDEANILMIKDLLKKEQILKMKNLFEHELRKDIQERLTNSICKVFDISP